ALVGDAVGGLGGNGLVVAAAVAQPGGEDPAERAGRGTAGAGSARGNACGSLGLAGRGGEKGGLTPGRAPAAVLRGTPAGPGPLPNRRKIVVGPRPEGLATEIICL